MSQTFWNECLDALKKGIPANNFAMWIHPLQAVMIDEHLMILAPNDFVLNGLRAQFMDVIQTVVNEINGTPLTIKFGVGSSDDYKESKQNILKKTPKRPVKPRYVSENSISEKPLETSNLNPEFSFDNYVEGKSNCFALAACSGVAKQPGTAHNPLFIHGNTGLGKTHLMHSVGNAILETYPDARIMYQHCDSFIEDIVRTIRNGTINELRHFYKSLDALLIDDIQLLSGKEASQEVFFHTFNSLLDGGHQVILTCDRYPKELDAMEDRLKSRFAAGLIVNIEPPEFEHRVAILQRKASHWGMNLHEDCAFFIAQTVRSSIRELEGALKQTNAIASFRGSELTLDIAQEALANLVEIQAKQITIANIQKIVCDYYKIKIVDLNGKSRAANFAKPRQIAMYIARMHTQCSLPEIGRAFFRDHSTVMHACTKVGKDLKLDDLQLKRDLDALSGVLGI